ncbi:MAG: RICIN domain-containing protein, partial [Lachnospiraceae bacterium]|nr:RICIN domain-containing protein [Lachnospiraceae bacterium]
MPRQCVHIAAALYDANGLENYYSYHTQSAGKAGTGYVNDFNGNLVFVHEDAATSGNRMPVKLNHVYNLARRKEWNGIGNGWRLSACQTLKPSDKTDFPYVYMDGDGTEHYFYKDTSDGNKLKDENGLGYVITTESSGNTAEYRIIQREDKSQMIFAQDGYLRKEKDTNGNTITYSYATGSNGPYLTEITDPTGAVITLVHQGNRLVKIKDVLNRATFYNYDDKKNLTSITYPDGKVTTFTYDTAALDATGGSDPGKLLSVRASDGYEIDYSYITDHTVKRVGRITEKNGTSIGQELKISYKNGNTTIFEECGLDGELSQTGDNRTYTYQFDNNGRPVCVIDSEGNAESFSYFSAGAKNNKLSKTGSTIKTIVNHMRNLRIERELYHWTICGSDTATVERTAEKGYIGTCSARITKTGALGESGIMQDHVLNPGTYTFSAYVSVEAIGAGGAFHLFVKGIKADGTQVLLADSPGITSKTDPAVDGGWLRESVTFTTDDTYTGVNVYAAIGNTTGTAYVTCFQLEEGTIANRLNLLENGSFDRAGDYDAIPGLFGSQEVESGDGRTTANALFGTHSVHIKGTIGKRKGYTQSITLRTDEKTVFSVSGWAKANAVPNQEFAIIMGFWYSDGTYKFENIPFNRNITDWQFVHKAVSPNDDKENTNKTMTSMRIYIFYGQNQNDAYFDGLQITCDDGESFVYDDNGDLTSAASVAQKSGFSYDTNRNLSKMVDMAGNSFEYGYDDKKNLIMAQNSEGVRCRFQYDGNGNPQYATVQSNGRLGAVTPGRVYYIRERVSGKYLGAKENGTADGTNCVLNTYSGHGAQKWKVMNVEKGYVQFIPQHAAGMSMDIVGAANADGARIMISVTDYADSQKFKLRYMKDGSYEIFSKCGKDVRGLTNEGNNTGDGAVVSIWSVNDGLDRQRWYLEPADLGTVTDVPKAGSIYEIRLRHSGQYLQAVGGSSAAGTGLEQYDYGAKMSQQFLLEDAGNGYYYIRPLHALQTALAVQGTYSGYPAVTLQTKDAASDLQKFRFEPLGTGYAIRCKGTDGTFGVLNNSYAKNQRVVAPTGTITADRGNRIFLLEECSGRIETAMTHTSDGRNVRTVTDASGNVTTNTYDNNNRLLTGVTDGNGNVISYTYDENTDELTAVCAMVDGQEVKNTYTYDSGHRLKTIGHNGFQYTFSYDTFGYRTGIQAGDKNLASYTYLPHNGPLSRLTYGNGDYLDYVYDREQRIQALKANGTVICENIYDGEGRMAGQKDIAGGVDYSFSYDLIGRLTAMDTSRGQQLRIGYDDKNRVDSVVHKVNGTGYNVSCLYGDVAQQQRPGLIYGLKVDDIRRQEISYDLLARISEKKILLDGGAEHTTTYAFADGPRMGTTTSLVERVTSGGKTLSYTYDGRGNILTISENGTLKVTYHYDALNRLVREDTLWENKTICCQYDLGGNLLSRTEHAYTTGTPGTALKTDTYSYRTSGWKDQLISYNGSSISYDDMGNPIQWKGMHLTWERGRMLKTLAKDGKTWSYTCDAGGNRVQKEEKASDGAVLATARYFLNGNKIVGMSVTKANGTEELTHFIYDGDGSLFAMKTSGGTYYYLHNQQNDIVGLIDSTGTQVVSYSYDSWGRLLGMTDSTEEQIGSKNPFRYREYFYDAETGLYYISSRYYDPEVGRWINEDSVIAGVGGSIQGYNMFAYCF